MLAQFAVGQVFLSMLWFFIFFMWIMLLFHVIGDVFRSRDLGGFAKVVWLLVVIVFPYLGVFIYLIARGGKMAEHNIEAINAQQQAAQEYIRSAAGTAASPADELARLAALREQGVITDAEFAQMKAKVLN